MLSAVLFDMGGTLEDIVHSKETEFECGTKLLAYLKKQGIELCMSTEVFMEVAGGGHKEYRAWADRNLRELTPYEVWSQWKLKGIKLDNDRLRAISEELSYMWDITYYHRQLRPDAKILLDALKAGGYQMGVISNTPSITQVFRMLEKYGIKDYFDAITVSSICGYKKPHRILFDVTLADMNVSPEEAVYVGDTVSRDVQGSRNAGMAMSIRIDSALTEGSDCGLESKTEADFVIKNLFDIYGILDNYNKGRGTQK